MDRTSTAGRKMLVHILVTITCMHATHFTHFTHTHTPEDGREVLYRANTFLPAADILGLKTNIFLPVSYMYLMDRTSTAGRKMLVHILVTITCMHATHFTHFTHTHTPEDGREVLYRAVWFLPLITSWSTIFFFCLMLC